MSHHLAGVLVVLALASVVVLHHAEMSADASSPTSSMPGMTMGAGGGHHDTGTAVMGACVCAFVALGAAIALTRFGVVRLGRWRVLDTAPQVLLLADRTLALPRAGPAGLPALGVWRI